MGIAFFDMDKTLLSASSSTLYVRHLWSRRLISLREVLEVTWVSMQYSLNMLNFPRAMARLSRNIKGGDATATQALCEQWVRDELVGYVAPLALKRLREHQQRGDHVVLLSASTQFIVRPIAEHLGIPYGCTELEVVDGKFTGGIVGEPCYGEGKRIWGERIAADCGVPLSECTFYTDSYSDRPLLDVVGFPVAVNPDAKLARYAARRGWRIERFY
ncbi:MAG: HAD family hydrolase [Anaerolineae bacterium]|nr:HAD-IB family hydrolase [Thermoflexales bacterium]MDW8395062.1 HAD family hydrolase [Anaerolineae bacterium]